MNRWYGRLVMGLFAAGGLGACAHGNAESQQAMATPPPEETAQVGTEVTAPPSQPMAQAQPSEQTNVEGARLRPQGTRTRTTGTFQTPQGQVYRPEGTYGSMARLEVRGTEGVQEEYGTYVKPKCEYRSPQAVVVNPQGRYVKPFGQPAVALGEGNLNERIPVAGHETSYFIVKGPQGNNWEIRNPQLIRQAQERMEAAGLKAGKRGEADQQFGAALLKFQQRNGLPPTGVIDQATARALGLDWSQLSAAAQRQERMPGQHQMPSEQR